MNQQSGSTNQIWTYSQLSKSFTDSIDEALKQKNQLYSCNTTALHLKQAYQKVNHQKINQNKLIHHKKQFPPEQCQNHLFKKLGLQQDLRKALMFRFPIHDIKHNYDHYVTIFKETFLQKDVETEFQGKLQTIWVLVHSWQNVYSLKNWVYDVDIKVISKNLSDQQFDPINHLKDFMGYFNQKWFYQFYKDRQHQKHNIFPRFEQIFSFNSNDQEPLDKYNGTPQMNDLNNKIYFLQFMFIVIYNLKIYQRVDQQNKKIINLFFQNNIIFFPQQVYMHTDRSHQSSKLNFYRHGQLKSIQEFVNTKIYNPKLIEKLKQKELKKFQLQKTKLIQSNLQIQIQKQSYKLQKVKKSQFQLKQYASIKDKQFYKIQELMTRMEQNISKILNPSNLQNNDKKAQQNNIVLRLKIQSEILVQNTKDERLRLSSLKQNKKQQFWKQINKKQNVIKSIELKQNTLLQRKSQIQVMNKIILQKKTGLNDLKIKKQTILANIKQKVVQKQNTLKNLKIKVSQNTKTQDQCIKKLSKFVNQLKLIIQNSKSLAQQKKTLIDLLLNVYCPNQSIKNIHRPSSLSPLKGKHDSIQTRTSIQKEYRLSNQENQKQIQTKQLKIPIILLHSLQQLEIKYGLCETLVSSPKKIPVNIKKQSSFQQNDKTQQKTNIRNSLPTSLNQKDLQIQFVKYCENQLNQLQTVDELLNTKQNQLDKQINLLKQKSNQKDIEIKSIKQQNRKSYSKK